MKDELYYESLDKRTKEYKEWVASQDNQSEGLGDTIEKITEATGIKKAVKFIAGEDCGCDKRKEKLNELFPYKKPECLTEDEYNYLIEEMRVAKNVIPQLTQIKMLKIYNRVFHDKKKPSSCGPCFLEPYNALKKLIQEYK